MTTMVTLTRASMLRDMYIPYLVSMEKPHPCVYRPENITSWKHFCRHRWRSNVTIRNTHTHTHTHTHTQSITKHNVKYEVQEIQYYPLPGKNSCDIWNWSLYFKILMHSMTSRGTPQRCSGGHLLLWRKLAGKLWDSASVAQQTEKKTRSLTLVLLTWTIWRAPTNASKWRTGFNSAFKG